MIKIKAVCFITADSVNIRGAVGLYQLNLQRIIGFDTVERFDFIAEKSR